MARRSKKLPIPVTEVKREGNYCYCRRCMQTKKKEYFYPAVDSDLDRNGRMSVCVDCCKDIFEDGLGRSNNSIELAVLYTCRKLGIKYDERPIEIVKKMMDGNKYDIRSFFGLYKAKLLIINRTNTTDDNMGIDLTYQDNPVVNLPKREDDEDIFEPENEEELKVFWGDGFSSEELEILESKYSQWCETHSIDTQSEKILLKYICLKEYEIDKAAKLGNIPSSLLKEFQDLLKTSGLDPSSASAASAGKSQETWGNFIKMIEETEPAEYYKDKELFKDFDNINLYWENFVVRPIRNFFGLSKDFSLKEVETEYEEETDSDSDFQKLEYKPEE